jgi:hypothetical protein
MLFSTGFLTPMDCLVGIATRYGLDSLGSIPGRGNDFYLLNSVETGLGAHPALCAMGRGSSFLEGKTIGA